MTLRAPLVAASLLLASVAPARAEVGIVSSKHNLSVSGRGPVRASTETEVCIFCHVGHGGRGLGENRPLSAAARYTPYNSSTLVSQAPGAPSGATRICLSCHDGTIAMGETVAGKTVRMVSTSSREGGRMPEGRSDLGTDLRTSHPVSFRPAPSAELRTPRAGDLVRLDSGGRLQCTSCHDPHEDEIDPDQGDFLVAPNRASALCLTCHAETWWQSNPSSHQSSTARYDASKGATTAYDTVADNGCGSCHVSHGAASASRLLDRTGSGTCLKCHSGQVAAVNIATDLSRTANHPVLSSDPAAHDAAEGRPGAASRLPETSSATPRHVECVDCHNPHAAYDRDAKAPDASGALSGVWGIDRAGARVDPVRYEYEICFKCHGDSANQPQRNGPAPPATVRRAQPDLNLRRRFDLDAPSSHPVEGPGRGTDVPSLIAPLTTQSVIYCSDCHASNTGPGAGGQGARGPHGSSYPHLLERAFSTADNTVEGPGAYALCYKCHDRTTLLSDRSAFASHALHVQREHAPCSACHDWHGVSVVQGDRTHNAHLIDFDVSIVKPTARGRREYESLGLRTGRCSVACHGIEHDGVTY
jgi:predicted CXXCH cytochrome family protein